MYNSGDAAEQIVRISLEGTEVALKLTGSAAKNIAAMIYAVLKNRDKNKTKGRQRLTAMIKSGTPPPRKYAQTAAGFVTIWMCRQISVITPLPTPC